MRQLKLLLQNNTFGDLLALLSGCALPLAFAPFRYYFLGFIAPALLLALWLNVSPRRALWRGWLFGLGYFGVGVSWVYVSIHTYGQASLFFSCLATGIFIVGFALYPAIQGYLLNRFFPNPTLQKCLLAFPATWTLLEWIRSWFLTGFPWLSLGYSQINSPLAGLAPLVGVYGITLITLICSGILVTLFLNPQRRLRLALIGLLIFILAGAAGLRLFNWTKPIDKPIKVTLVQGNVPQELKWQQQQIIHILRTYWQLTNQHWDSQLIIWPEAAITISNIDAADFLRELNQAAKQHHNTVIAGIPIIKGPQYYNGVIAVGDGSGEYLKRHLVPFGEYVPLRFIFDFFNHYVQIPMSDMSFGPKNQPELHTDGHTIAPFICYEIIFPEEVIRSLPQAQLLLVVSDDSWFGNSIAAAQHLEMGQMRAVETGRDLLFSTNNGITAFVNAQGKIVSMAPEFKTTTLTDSVQAHNGSTPFTILSSYPTLLCCLLFLMLAWRNRITLQ